MARTRWKKGGAASNRAGKFAGLEGGKAEGSWRQPSIDCQPGQPTNLTRTFLPSSSLFRYYRARTRATFFFSFFSFSFFFSLQYVLGIVGSSIEQTKRGHLSLSLSLPPSRSSSKPVSSKIIRVIRNCGRSSEIRGLIRRCTPSLEGEGTSSDDFVGMIDPPFAEFRLVEIVNRGL